MSDMAWYATLALTSDGDVVELTDQNIVEFGYHDSQAVRMALAAELLRLEAAAPLSALETTRYLEIERRIMALDAAAIRAQGE